jgi:exosortase
MLPRYLLLTAPAPALSDNDPARGASKTQRAVFPGWFLAAAVILPLGYLWFRLINNLRLEWSTNPQYSYGWVVPFLCLSFILQRWQNYQLEKKAQPVPGSASNLTLRLSSPSAPKLTVLLFLTLAVLYFPTRLLEEATPEWRPNQWMLGFEAIGLTLCAINLRFGRGWLRQLAFPFCFFLVAIPWPMIIETPVIQSLTRINSGIVVELLGWFDIPSIQQGNLIEVSTGKVGVSEACSGIRSFQTSLMVSLFFGEFYAMGLWRRLLLIPAGFILAMSFNVCRMTFLTVIAAKKGVDAIAVYHDPAGILITVVCSAGLWGLALLFNRRSKIMAPAPKADTHSDIVSDASSRASSLPRLFPLSLGLLVWLVAAEVGTELWYRNQESHLAASPKWSALFPTNNPTFQPVPIAADTSELLQFDDGKQADWVDSDGFRWQAFYFDWWPGRVAGYLAKRHTPEICLPATGCNIISGPELTMTNINGVALPIRSYVFGTAGGGSFYVFHCRWEAGVNEASYVLHESGRFNLIRGIWAGRGKFGQKILEVIITGCPDADQAKASLVRQLQTMITVESPTAKS